ncbi:MAG: hypothetical protein M0Z58_07940 [Nitrospiraceae bacterium]|nr:hypothetical protein [Nitrospiraceae bacterium]
MNIQSIGGMNQNVNSVRTDFRNFSSAAGNLQGALNSGNQDQITLSETALSKALGQMLGDAPGNAQTQSAGGGSGGQSNPMQTLQTDLQALRNALNSASSSGTSSSTSSSANSTLSDALEKIESDLSDMKSHAHHKRPHMLMQDASSASAAGGSQAGASMAGFQNDLNVLENALNAATGSQGAADAASNSNSKTLAAALNQVLSDMSYFAQGQSPGYGNSGGMAVETYV